MKVNSAIQALSILNDGDVIWCQSMAATPYKLLEGLKEVAKQRVNLTLLQLHTEYSEALGDPELNGHLRQRAFLSEHQPARPLIRVWPTTFLFSCLKFQSCFVQANNRWTQLLFRYRRQINTVTAV